MTEALTLANVLPAETAESLAKIMALEGRVSELPQKRFRIEHVLHAGMYSRTCRLVRGDLIIGAPVKVATQLIVNGSALILVGGKSYAIRGYQVIAASAGRKQVFVAEGDVEITMIFPTSAKTVEAAEDEFTEHAETLQTRTSEGDDMVTITGIER